MWQKQVHVPFLYALLQLSAWDDLLEYCLMMIFSPTLEEIEKHHYRLIEDIPKEEWGLNDPSLGSHERKAIERTMKSLVELNGILESGE